MLPPSDHLIVGAGIIGLSLALELRARGYKVTVVDRGTPFSQASGAAAGMLAAEDPHNPLELHAFARFSASIYPDFLARVEELSGLAVPFQTDTTYQTMPDGTTRLFNEHSIDPRQLAPALVGAVEAFGIPVLRLSAAEFNHVGGAHRPAAATRVFTTGAWGWDQLPVMPRKGQMLRVRLPPGLTLEEVHRSEPVYVVPRLHGPQAGTALIGATVEDAGFDTSTHPLALAHLRELGAELVPGLRDQTAAPTVESWAGLRPATIDGLPVLGAWDAAEHAHPQDFIATGHFRNGILLAPATAVVMADLIEERAPKLPLEAFSPHRFQAASLTKRSSFDHA